MVRVFQAFFQNSLSENLSLFLRVFLYIENLVELTDASLFALEEFAFMTFGSNRKILKKLLVL